jgi:transposase
MVHDMLYVGLDTDKKHIDVALAEPLPAGEVRYWGKIAADPVSLNRVVARLRRQARELVVCYEAGPCGYGLYRQLSAVPGVTCLVVAPSMTPRRSGVRVKTNRRDAVVLARLLRAQELTAVWVPDPAHEAMRDLVRARANAVEVRTRCCQHIGSFLLRQDIRYTGTPWTKKHRAWLGRLALADPAHRLMFGELLEALDQAQARCRRLTDHITERLPHWSLAWLVEALQVLRGYRLINAVTVAAEIGDPRRFDTPRQLMGYLGMVPSEHSTGASVRRGGITKTGNKRVRKALIEAAWTYMRPTKAPVPTRHPAALRAIADRARHRLSLRFRKLMARGKLSQVAATAVARESVGFIWAVAQAAAPTPPQPPH